MKNPSDEPLKTAKQTWIDFLSMLKLQNLIGGNSNLDDATKTMLLSIRDYLYFKVVEIKD